MSGVRLRIIDAFTERPYAGNPAGVVLLESDGWPDEAWMRQVAAELNLSETAFAYPLPSGAEADWALRWFTPVVEEDLCGHATLATAHAIATDAGISTSTTSTTSGTRPGNPATIRFTSRSGVLPVHLAADGAITLDFPAAPVTVTPVPDGLANALGATPDAVYATGALRDLLVVLPEEPVVRALVPDLAAVARLARRHGIRGITVTAVAGSPDDGYDFVSRFFSPADGIPEDPVTGSAHTALAPYWARRLGRDSLVGLQASARTGLVRTALRGDRVHLTGHAVTVLDGTWLHGPVRSPT